MACEKPTAAQLREVWQEELDGWEQVHEEADPGYRHGCYMLTVFHRQADNTFWAASYTVSGDGEENGLREGDATVRQVWPHQVTTTAYLSKPPAA
ncbi:hypothetical protein [Methylobacterium marchantiae]|uniref:Uncharacterized protein n=1 Tax=Methylobacterium marchantiae TaxID=600331 RepID=A0ABW3X5E4_9HYPH|nr:hypothetical protein AIGOOFII_3511 [Methylobacterium marchantiae]